MSVGIPALTVAASGVSSGSAAAAYARADQGGGAQSGTDTGFDATLGRAISGAISLGNASDTAATAALEGNGDISAVVTAVSRAELALQAATAIRDKVVSAYQTIMSMPI